MRNTLLIGSFILVICLISCTAPDSSIIDSSSSNLNVESTTPDIEKTIEAAVEATRAATARSTPQLLPTIEATTGGTKAADPMPTSTLLLTIAPTAEPIATSEPTAIPEPDIFPGIYDLTVDLIISRINDPLSIGDDYRDYDPPPEIVNGKTLRSWTPLGIDGFVGKKNGNYYNGPDPQFEYTVAMARANNELLVSVGTRQLPKLDDSVIQDFFDRGVLVLGSTGFPYYAAMSTVETIRSQFNANPKVEELKECRGGMVVVLNTFRLEEKVGSLQLVVMLADESVCPVDTNLVPTPTRTLTPAPTLTPVPTVTPMPRPTATPKPSRATSFSDGTWVVGADILHGTYRSSKLGSGCYWERLSGFSGQLGNVITNEITNDLSLVEISSTDAGFSTRNCGTWRKATTRITTALTSPFGDGAFIVGLDVASGTWRSPGGDSCYWERLSGFSGELKHVVANDVGSFNNIITIQSTDKGFKSMNCGTWTKQ